ncbi:MAG: YciC family protein [Pirellula sp.]
MNEINPYQASTYDRPMSPIGQGAIPALKQAAETFAANWMPICGFMFLVWAPIDLLSCYADDHFFGEEDYLRSMRFSLSLSNFFGIIATGGIVAVAKEYSDYNESSFVTALGTSVGLWPKIFWTNFVSSLFVMLGFICFVVPGLMAMIFLSLLIPIIVCENQYGIAACKRSYELTRGNAGQILWIAVAFLLLFILWFVVLGIREVFAPDWNHWALTAIVEFPLNIVSALMHLSFFAFYRQTVAISSQRLVSMT